MPNCEKQPGCGRREDDGVALERIRRITGYLVGTLNRFNNAKRAEERDRVKLLRNDTAITGAASQKRSSPCYCIACLKDIAALRPIC